MATPAAEIAGVLQRASALDIPKIRTQVEAELARQDLRLFLREAWSQVEPKAHKSNWHTDAICDHLAWVTLGEIRNLMINIPPRQTKSLAASVIWPVWSWLMDPTIQFLCASYVGELAIRDAVKSRRLIESAWFKERYGHIFYLDPTDNRKHRYLNNLGGHRISSSVGGKTTGEGGDMLVIDDAHNMKEVYSDATRHGVLTWHDNSWRSRLNDAKTGQKVYIGQRSHDADLYGHVLATEDERWVTLMLPMEFDPPRKCITYFNHGVKPLVEEGLLFEDPRTEKGELLNPKRFGPEEVKTERKAMSIRDYSAQYQQDPTSGGGLILKKKWWRQWTFPEGHKLHGESMALPEFSEVISVYDTAFEIDEENDCSARTTWGIFMHSDGPGKVEKPNVLLLERFNDKVEFPDLKTEALEHDRAMSPDATLIEKKASGHSLIQELRRTGISVRPIKLDTKDKVFRAHMVQQILKEGRVWYLPRNWAFEVIDQCAKFPVGEYDDLVDTVVMCLAYIRRMGMIELPDDEKDDEMKLFATPKKFYG